MIPTELQAGDYITVSNDDVPFTEAQVTDVDVADMGLTVVYGVGIVSGDEQYAIEGTTASNESTITDVHNSEEWEVENEAITLQ